MICYDKEISKVNGYSVLQKLQLTHFMTSQRNFTLDFFTAFLISCPV